MQKTTGLACQWIEDIGSLNEKYLEDKQKTLFVDMTEADFNFFMNSQKKEEEILFLQSVGIFDSFM